MNESCAGAQRSKKAVQRLLNRQPSKALLAGSIFLCVGLSGCGLSDLYKDKEKRCKLNCTTEDSDSKKSVEPFNFDLEYWNKTTPRSKLDPAPK